MIHERLELFERSKKKPIALEGFVGHIWSCLKMENPTHRKSIDFFTDKRNITLCPLFLAEV